MPRDAADSADVRSNATDKSTTSPMPKSWAETYCLIDLLKTAVVAGIADPARGLAQAIDHERHTKFEHKIDNMTAFLGLTKDEPAKSGAHYYAEQLGNAIGMMAPMMLMRGGGGLIAKRFLKTEQVASASLGETKLLSHAMLKAAGKEAIISGANGMAYGTAFRIVDDSDSKSSFWQKRFNNGVSDMTTFALLGGTNPLFAKSLGSLASTIERVPISTADSFIKRSALPIAQKATAYSLRMPVVSGALSGIPGGAINAELEARQDDRYIPTLDELKHNIVSNAFIGSAFAGSSALLAARPSPEKMRVPSAPSERQVPRIEDNVTDHDHSTSPKAEIPKFETTEAANAAFKDLVAGNNWKEARVLLDGKAVDKSIIQDPAIHDAALSAFNEALGKNNWKDINEIVNTGALKPEEFKSEAAKTAAFKQLSDYVGENMLDHARAIVGTHILDAESYQDPSLLHYTEQKLRRSLSQDSPDRFNEISQFPWVNSEMRKEQAANALTEFYEHGGKSLEKVSKNVQALGILQADEMHASKVAGVQRSISFYHYENVSDIPKIAESVLGKDWHQDPEIQRHALATIEDSIRHGQIYKKVLPYQEWGLVPKDLLASEHMHQVALEGLPRVLDNDIKKAAQGLDILQRSGINFSSAEVHDVALEELAKRGYKNDHQEFMDMLKDRFNVELKPEEVRAVGRSIVASHLSEWDVQDAQRIIDSFKLSKEDVHDAAASAIPEAISQKRIDIANALIHFYEVKPEAVETALKEAIGKNDITSALRVAMSQQETLNNALEKYLGVKELNSSTARELFEKLSAEDPEWGHTDNVQNPFNDGAKVFGEEKMLRFALNPSASPHDALNGFNDVIALYHQSKMTPDAFYGKILSQVSRETAIDDEGSAYHKLNKIAATFPDDVNAILAKGREHPEIPKLQELVDQFENKSNIFSDWEHLQRFSKLQWMVESTELLPELKELRANGKTQLADWVESLAFHPDSRISIHSIKQFWQEPAKFLDLEDLNSGKAHGYKKPSNYTDIAHLDMTAQELRDALVNGTLDRLQVFKPMKIEYDISPKIDLGQEFDKALGSRRAKREGSATNTNKLFHEVGTLLKSSGENFTIQDLVAGKEPPPHLEEPLKNLLYNVNYGIKAPDAPMKLIAEIHRKSDPLAVLAGDDTASCMGFGTGKNNIYMFNPNDSQFTVRLVRADGTSRTIAQSVLTKDKDIKASVPEVMAKMDSDDVAAAHSLIPDEAMKTEKAILAADNVEVHPNYKGGKYPEALEAVYRDFFNRYLEEHGATQNLRTDKMVIGLGYSDVMTGLPKEANTYVPQAPAAYSDKLHAQVYALHMDRPQNVVAEPTSITMPKQAPSTSQQVSNVEGISPLTFEDSLSAAHLESKAYQDNASLVHGLHNVENSLIAQSINNEIKSRPNLSMKYTDSHGVVKGYIIGYEGKLEQNGIDRPVVFVSDYSTERRIGLDGTFKAGRPGGKLLQAFMEQYKKNYLDKGDLIPVFVNAREETSYKLLLKNIQAISKTLGYDFEIKETGTEQAGESTMHDLLLIPKARRAATSH